MGDHQGSLALLGRCKQPLNGFLKIIYIIWRISVLIKIQIAILLATLLMNFVTLMWRKDDHPFNLSAEKPKMNHISNMKLSHTSGVECTSMHFTTISPKKYTSFSLPQFPSRWTPVCILVMFLVEFFLKYNTQSSRFACAQFLLGHWNLELILHC